MVTYDCFKNKISLVTGGCSGIGLAVAGKFAEQGSTIVILDLDKGLGRQTMDYFASVGAEAMFIQTDVCIEADIRKAIAKIDHRYGRLDYAYNNAGIGGEFAKLQDYPVLDWNKVIMTNLTGVFLCMKYQIPLMLRSAAPAIVNCASVLSTVAFANDAAYVASKFGVLGLTKNAALEYAATHLRINAVSPGFTHTSMIDKNEGDKAKLKALAKRHPIGRIAKTDEIAEAVLWLCSTSASFAIGMNLLVDGGYTLQ